MARRRFFVDEVREGRAQIEGDEAHHLSRVLRVEAGQRFEISDNQSVYLAQIEAVRKDLVTFSIVDRIVADEPQVRITLLASLIRFERFEWMIEKATELGVEHIIPVQADRSEKGLDLAARKRKARWSRIAREASEQSRRARLTAIADAARLSVALASEIPHRFALDEDRAAPPILRTLPERRASGDQVAMAVGPEGGWTPREQTLLLEKGWKPVSLGPTILKTETAVVAALAIVNAAWQAGT